MKKAVSFRLFCSQPIRQRLHPRTGFSEPVEQTAVSIPTANPVVLPSEPTKIEIGLPLSEDLKAGPIAKTIHTQWSNIPLQVRRTMSESVSTSAGSSSLLSDTPMSPLIAQAKNMLALLGRGPADLQLHRKQYCSDLSLVPYKKGMKAAYHWPRVLIPRTVAARCREDLRVDPVDADRSVLLLDQLLDKTTVVLCFSGYDLSGLNTGAKVWKSALSDHLPEVQLINIHFCEGWLSRRTHPLTRQILRTFRSEDVEPGKQDRMFVYRGKWHRDLVLDFHLYNKSLPSILFIDKLGYVRWHAVGLPTEESVNTMLPLLQKLVKEKQ